MALSEEQIRRYGRQILLREVGGAGQRRLLAAPVELAAQGPAAEVAVTYLAAGGSPIIGAAGPWSGFLTAAGPQALSHDTTATRAPTVRLAAQALADCPIPQVLLGAELTVLPPGACPACAAVPQAEIWPDSVAFGAFAALLVQRLVLGQPAREARFRWVDGSFKEVALVRCASHR